MELQISSKIGQGFYSLPKTYRQDLSTFMLFQMSQKHQNQFTTFILEG